MSALEELIGKTINKIQGGKNSDELVFECSDGKKYKMHHYQSCCESVSIDDIVGDLENLVGSPILVAAEVSCDQGAKEKYDESYTWTFYKFATIKGSVDIKWYGSSNGYYSESVDFEEIK